MNPSRRNTVDVCIATHVAEAYGPQYVLEDYLKEQGKSFAYIGCPFDYAKIPRAKATHYKAGKPVAEIYGHANNTHGVVSWVRDAWFVLRCGWTLMDRQSIFIGINNLNAAMGIVLRWFGCGHYVIYYVIDYTPARFPSRVINGIYQALARFAARHADMVWNLSERMRTVHARFGARPATNIMVPIGLHTDEFQVQPEDEIERFRMVVVSTLFESKGVQLTLAALPYLPQARLTIIGTGPYAGVLQKLAQDLGVADRVTFLGMVDRKTVFAHLSRSRMALAPYLPDPANYSYFADPAKPKEYLACGVPVIITRVPWIAEDIEKRPMGIAIEYDAKQLAQAANRLMEDDVFWRTCRNAAIEFSRGSDWQGIFQHAWAAVQADPRCKQGKGE